MVKNILIVAAVVLLLYACTPSYAQSDPPTEQEKAGCYEEIGLAARDVWPGLSRIERFALGMRAIQLCEGGN